MPSQATRVDKDMMATYYEIEVSYKGKKVDRFLIPASSGDKAHDIVRSKATELTQIRIIRIIGPDDGELQ